MRMPSRVLLAHAGVNIEESTCKQVETGDFFNILAVRKMSGWMKQVPACLLCPYPAFMRTDQITPEIKVNLQ